MTNLAILFPSLIVTMGMVLPLHGYTLRIVLSKIAAMTDSKRKAALYNSLLAVAEEALLLSLLLAKSDVEVVGREDTSDVQATTFQVAFAVKFTMVAEFLNESLYWIFLASDKSNNDQEYYRGAKGAEEAFATSTNMVLAT